MSTRSQLIIKKDNVCYLYYRHFDGYLKGAGEDLRNVFCVSDNFKEVIDSDEQYEYEDIFESLSQIHGDIEYLYYCDLDKHCLLYKTIEGWGKEQNLSVEEIEKLIDGTVIQNEEWLDVLEEINKYKVYTSFKKPAN